MQRSVMTCSGRSRTSELVMTGLPSACVVCARYRYVCGINIYACNRNERK